MLNEEISNDRESVREQSHAEIEYCVLDPTGNITILVTTPVPVELQPRIAAELMRIIPESEQVGFLTHDDSCNIALRMAGGEFCGNASMSAAVYAADKAGAVKSEVVLRVSGSEEPIRAEVEKMSDGSWTGTVNMPRPAKIERVVLPGAGSVPVVCFEGIHHVILEEKIEEARAEEYARMWCRELAADAIGLMFLDRANAKLTPLVYVPSADTICWENSCASGTTAAVAYLASESGAPVRMTLSQPGGGLTVEVSEDGIPRLQGHVRILHYGRTVVTYSSGNL